jgi:hypothetical protein
MDVTYGDVHGHITIRRVPGNESSGGDGDVSDRAESFDGGDDHITR